MSNAEQQSSKKSCGYVPVFFNVFLSLLFPGIAHFLSGKIFWGIFWFAGFFLLIFFLLFFASIPGITGAVLSLLLFLSCLVFYTAMIISSRHASWKFNRVFIVCLIVYYILIECVFPQFIYLYKNNVAQGYKCMSSSMVPTLRPSSDGCGVNFPDFTLCNKWIYRFFSPKHGDVVLFIHSKTDTTPRAKRVVGIPGDTIDIVSPHLIVNGEPLTSPPIFLKLTSARGYTNSTISSDSRWDKEKIFENRNLIQEIQFPLKLQADEYFLLGDNSYNSFDSRYFGPITKEKIQGRIVRIIYPVSRMKTIE